VVSTNKDDTFDLAGFNIAEDGGGATAMTDDNVLFADFDLFLHEPDPNFLVCVEWVGKGAEDRAAGEERMLSGGVCGQDQVVDHGRVPHGSLDAVVTVSWDQDDA